MTEFDRSTLPMGALGPDKDIPAGRDESGNRQYRTLTGQVYTLREITPQSPWTTEPMTMARVGEVAKYRLTQLGEAVVSGITAPGRALRGEPVTEGEALNTAGMAATGSLPMPAPTGALRVFGGASRNSNKYSEFLDNALNGMDPQTNFEKTRFYQSPATGEIKFEIPDTGAALIAQVDRNTDTFLDSVYDHPELYKYYPEARDIKFKGYYENSNVGGFFKADENSININMAAINRDWQKNGFSSPTAALESVMVHELQHWIQRKEGFIGKGASQSWHPVVARAQQDVKEDLMLGLIDSSQVSKELRDGVYQWYLKDIGETEARNAQLRLRDRTKRLWIPIRTQDIPEWQTAKPVRENGVWIMKMLGEIDASLLPKPAPNNLTGPQ